MKTQAAILVQTNQPLVVADIEIPVLKPGQVLVRVQMSGVCHTQLLECRGARGEDKFLPHCLGHEGAGIVEETGPNVTKVKAGDTVILSWMKGSGADVPGSTYRWENKTVNSGAITTFSRLSVISENRLTVIAKNSDTKESALLGCALPTGMGSVLNSGAAKTGESIAVFGLGGVGLCAFIAAVAQSGSPVFGIDVNDSKLSTAKQFGEAHLINSSRQNALEEIRRICPNGVDLAIEASGQPDVMRLALSAVKPRGGRAVIVGNAKHGAQLTIDPHEFNQGKRLLGTWGGDNNPDSDFVRYQQLLKSKKISLAALTSSVYPLAKINEAIDDLEKGRAVRPLIDMSLS